MSDSKYNIVFMGVDQKHLWGFKKDEKKESAIKDWMINFLTSSINFNAKRLKGKFGGFRIVTGLNNGSEQMFAKIALGVAAAVNAGDGKAVGVDYKGPIEVWAYQPYNDFEKVWPEFAQEEFKEIRSKMDNVKIFQEAWDKNVWMNMYGEMADMAHDAIICWKSEFEKENPGSLGTVIRYMEQLKPKPLKMFISPDSK